MDLSLLKHDYLILSNLYFDGGTLKWQKLLGLIYKRRGASGGPGCKTPGSDQSAKHHLFRHGGMKKGH